jgi:thiosulfate/3-mercaptopyruvate sulfurtransferase
MVHSVLKPFIDVLELWDMLRAGSAVVLDVRRFDDYVRGHIPGSSWLYFWDLTLYERGLPSTPKPRSEVASVFGRAGVGDEDFVVIVYDKRSLLYATYTAWFLEYVGHQRYSLLRGGFEAWVSAGLPIERGVLKVKPKSFTVKGFPQARATIDDVLEVVRGKADHLLLDVRTKAEHTGDIATAGKAGRIPKSTLLEPELLLKVLEGDLEATERVKTLIGDLSSRNAILYCTSGERASMAWFALSKLLGLPNIKLFPEGFLEYSKRNLPVEVGDLEASSSRGVKVVKIDRNALCEQGLANPMRYVLESVSKLEKGGKLILELNDADWILALKKVAGERGFKVEDLGSVENGFTRILIERP